MSLTGGAVADSTGNVRRWPSRPRLGGRGGATWVLIRAWWS